MPQDKVKEVYGLISDLGYFKDENEFKNYVSDPKKRKEAFDLIADEGYFKDENEFNSYFTEVKPTEPPIQKTGTYEPRNKVAEMLNQPTSQDIQREKRGIGVQKEVVSGTKQPQIGVKEETIRQDIETTQKQIKDRERWQENKVIESAYIGTKQEAEAKGYKNPLEMFPEKSDNIANYLNEESKVEYNFLKALETYSREVDELTVRTEATGNPQTQADLQKAKFNKYKAQVELEKFTKQRNAKIDEAITLNENLINYLTAQGDSEEKIADAKKEIVRLQSQKENYLQNPDQKIMSVFSANKQEMDEFKVPGNTPRERVKNYALIVNRQIEEIDEKIKTKFPGEPLEKPSWTGGYKMATRSPELEVLWERKMKLTPKMQALAQVALVDRMPTKTTGGFIGSMFDAISKELLPDKMTQTNLKDLSIQDVGKIIEENQIAMGLTDEMVKESAVKQTKELQTPTEFFSAEGMGNLFGTSLSMIPAFTLGNKATAAMKIPQMIRMARMASTTTKYGKYLVPTLKASEKGIEYALAEPFLQQQSLKDEASFMSGFLGAAISKPVEKVLSGKNIQAMIGKMFGDKAPVVANKIMQLGNRVASGLGEYGEEVGNTVGSIVGDYLETKDFAELKKSLNEQFGSLEPNMELFVGSVVMGFFMGSGTGIGDAAINKSKEVYAAMTPEQKKTADEILKQFKDDLETSEVNAKRQEIAEGDAPPKVEEVTEVDLQNKQAAIEVIQSPTATIKEKAEAAKIVRDIDAKQREVVITEKALEQGPLAEGEVVKEEVVDDEVVEDENPKFKEETPILKTPQTLSTSGLQDLEIMPSKESSQALESEIGGDKGIIDNKVRSIPIQEYDVQSNKRSKEIAEQIEENGWIEPLIVSYDKNGDVYIVEGQHRAAALKELGYDKAPVIVIYDKTQFGKIEQAKETAPTPTTPKEVTPTEEFNLKEISKNIDNENLTRFQQLSESLKEGELLLKDNVDAAGNKLTPEKRVAIEKSIESTKQKIKDLQSPIQAPKTPQEVQVIDEESYLAQNGAPFMGGAEPALQKNIKDDRNKAIMVNKVQEDMAKNNAKREELRKEYAEKVAKGEIRPPTREEKLIETANGNEDLESTQAARRLLDKRGVAWEQPKVEVKEEPKEEAKEVTPTTPILKEEGKIEDKIEGKIEGTPQEVEEGEFTAKGGNKVVDEKGIPLVLYHGTSKGLQAEDLKQSGQAGDYGEGIYFATDKREAEQRNAENIIEANVKSDKHLVIGSKEYFEGIYKNLEKKYGSVIPQYAIGAEAKKAGYTSIEVERPEGKWIIAFDGAKIQSTKETPKPSTPPSQNKVETPKKETPKQQKPKAKAQPKTEKPKPFVSKSGKQVVGIDANGEMEVYDKATGKVASAPTRRKVLKEYIELTDFNKGERSVDPPEEFREKGYSDETIETFVVENSNNPLEVVEVFLRQEPVARKQLSAFAGGSKTDAIANAVDFPKIKRSGFIRFGDKNLINASMAKSYFSNDGIPIDVVAQSISEETGVEITTDDLVEFIVNFPNGQETALKIGDNKAASAARDKFKELTGLTLTKDIAKQIVSQQSKISKEQEQQFIQKEYERIEQLESEYWATYEESPINRTEDGGAIKTEQPITSTEGEGVSGVESETEVSVLPDQKLKNQLSALSEKDLMGLNLVSEKTKSNKDVSDAIYRMADNEMDALENVLFNWDAIVPIMDGSVIRFKGNIGRDREFSRGEEGGSYTPSKKDFLSWLLSDKPLSKEYEQNKEWKDNIEKLRIAAGFYNGNIDAIVGDYILAKVRNNNPKLVQAVEDAVSQSQEQALKETIAKELNKSANELGSFNIGSTKLWLSMAKLMGLYSKKGVTKFGDFIKATGYKATSALKSLWDAIRNRKQTTISKSVKNAKLRTLNARVLFYEALIGVDPIADGQTQLDDIKNTIATYKTLAIHANKNEVQDVINAVDALSDLYIELSADLNTVKDKIASQAANGQQAIELKEDLTTVGKLIESFADDFKWQEKVQNEIEKVKGTLPDDMNPYMQKDISIGRVENTISEMMQKIFGKRYGQLKTNKKGEKSLFERAAKDKISQEDLDFFMYVQHAKERNARVEAIKIAEKTQAIQEAQDRLADLATQDQTNPSVKAQTTMAKQALSEAQSMAIVTDGSGVSNEEADRFMQEFEKSGKVPKLEQYAKEYRETVITPMIDMMEEGNLLDADQAEMLRTGMDEKSGVKFDYYVPLKVEKEALEQSQGTVASASPTLLNPIKSIKGTSKYDYVKRISPIAQSISDFQAAAKSVEDNKTAQSLYKLVKENPNKDIWEIVSPTFMPNADGIPMNQTAQDVKDNSIPVKIDGKLKYIKLNHKGLREAWMRKQSNPAYIYRLILNVFRTYNNFKRKVLTQFSPEFALVNLIRDVQDAVFNSSGVDIPFLGKQIIGNLPKANATAGKAIFGNLDPDSDMGKVLDSYLANGGKISWANYNAIEDVQKEIDQMTAKFSDDKSLGYYGKNVFNKVVATIGSFNETVETGTRLATFKALIDNGITPEKAASISKNMTVNFNKRGTATPLLNAAYLFSNAGIQSIYVGAKGLAKSQKARRYAAYTMLTGLAVPFIQQMMIAALSDSDEEEREYKQLLTKEEQLDFLVIPTGKKEFLRIPKSYGMTRLFLNSGQEFGSAMIDGKIAEHSVNAASTLLSVIDPITGNANNKISAAFPTALRPLIEVLAINKDYKNAPIYPEDRFGPESADYLKFYPKTADFYKNFAENMYFKSGSNIDVSPETLEYIVNDFFSGIFRTGENFIVAGSQLAQGKEVDHNKIPFKSKFIVDMSEQDWRYTKDFWTIYNNSEKVLYQKEEIEEVIKLVMKLDAKRAKENGPPAVKDMQKKVDLIYESQDKLKQRKEAFEKKQQN